ncbi:MAG: PAS domain S-box protein, partial [Candidatus Omnitrophota bacterium]
MDDPYNNSPERRLAEEALRESEEKYRSLIENINIGVYRNTADPKGRFLQANNAYAKMLGYSNTDEFMALPVSSHYQNPADRKAFIEEIKRNGFVQSMEVLLKKKDGTPLIVSVSARAQHDEKGNIKWIDGVIEDITERKRMENELIKYRDHLEELVEERTSELKAVNEKLHTEIISREKSELALRESTKSYWSLFEESPVNMFIEDHSEVKDYIDSLPCKNGAELRIYFNDYPEAVRKCASFIKIADMNKRALLLFSARSKKDLKEGFDRTFTPETYEILAEWIVAFKDGSSTFKGEASIHTLTGEKRHTVIRASIVPGYESGWSKVLVSLIDITERKATEEALAISEANYRAIFDTANDGIFVFDIKTGAMIDVNRRGCEMYCYSKEEMLSTSLSDLSAGESPYTREDAVIWVKKAAAGEPQFVEWLSKDKAGHLFWVEINLRRAIIGSKYSLLAIVRDITERKCAEGRLEKINKTFLNFGTDTIENINRLTALLGDLLGADCALYNRLEEGKLFSCGIWNVPPGFKTVDKADGHICFNVIKNARDDIVVIRNLPSTKYARTDPNVKHYKLETYLGYGVKFGSSYVGSLCALYKRDFVPSEEDKRVMGVIASAIGIEEERMAAEKKIMALNKELIRSNNMLKQLAIRDSHTGLYGHRYLQEAIESEFTRAKKQSSPLSVIMLDIDFFKTINDVYGHQFGDMILRQFAVQL